MAFSRCIGVNNSMSVLVQIVHPGGHVELHDRAVSAGEIMCRYPRCCVTYPHVFQQPWAVVEPETFLVLGQKYYVVPMSTIRKLQGLSPRPSPSPSPSREIIYTHSSNVEENEDDAVLSTCCVFKNKSTAKQSNIYNKHSKNAGLSYDSCFVSLFDGARTKANVSDMTKETRTSSSSRKRTQDLTGNGLRSSPKKVWSSENWQPSLESITEE